MSPNSRSRVKLKSSTVSGQINFFKIAITYEIVHLDASTGKCFDYEKSSGHSDYDSCIFSELYKISKRSEPGRCTVPWLPRKDAICTDRTASQAAFKIYQNNRRNQNNICGNPCQFTNVYFGPPVEELIVHEESNDYKASLIIYFRREVKITSEYFLISIISMIAEIGGYAGLLLGFSIFNLTDVTDFLIQKWKKKILTRKKADQKLDKVSRLY